VENAFFRYKSIIGNALRARTPEGQAAEVRCKQPHPRPTACSQAGSRLRRELLDSLKDMLAGSTGLEPAASGVTGRRSSQLNYDPVTGKYML
jgi:hypothetical protein